MTAPAPFATSSSDAVTLGSAAKAWWGGLRVGWVRAPMARVADVVEARHSLDLGTAVLEQLVLADLLGQGAGLLDERREEARRRRDALVVALRRHVPDWSFTVPPGGLNLWCELPLDRGDELARAAEGAGVRLARGGQFGADGGMGRFVRVPFCVAPDEADEVGRRLAVAWQRALGQPGCGPRPAPPSSPDAPHSRVPTFTRPTGEERDHSRDESAHSTGGSSAHLSQAGPGGDQSRVSLR